jgi:hypothetical protein
VCSSDLERRTQDSIGGDLELPSIWTNYTISSLQDLFDEIFVYVHTIKEPASEYFETIKCIKTIRKFQSQYDQLTDREKLGIHTEETFKSHILQDRLVGCSVDVVMCSTKLYMEHLNFHGLKEKISNLVNQEELSALESTKAVIPEYSMKSVPEHTFKHIVNNQRKRPEEDDANIKKNLKNRMLSVLDIYKYAPKMFDSVIDGSAVVDFKSNNRVKVHDALHDILKREPSIKTTLDLSHWNFFSNNSKVDCHFCIKAQYGAKREFYVLNLGAKAMARSFESVFKAIAQASPNEMISVPGDQKLKHMDDIADKVLRWSTSTKDTIYYVNGDCTKWSACETMPSFYSMCQGLSSYIGEEASYFCKAVVACWGDKRIMIPDILRRKTKYITDKNKYLADSDYLTSTQNFLQGMFNYSSSVKAVIATEFAIHMWKKYNTDRKVYCKHLEHSDDYVLVVRVQTVRDFEDFRIYHKLSQRLHGINDSTKKTNSQRYIMEFISLMAFNGHMSYPNIKKTKEVGLNISSEGYQRDIMNVHSRSGESVRMGVPLITAYIQSLIQGINIYRSYSLNIGQRNENPSSYDPFNNPVELFGLPDCLPILYCSTNGDPNNYRIKKFSPSGLKLLRGLYITTIKYNNFDLIYEDTPNDSDFISPLYKYQRSGGIIKKIRQKLGWTRDDVAEFRDSHIEYLFLKPKESSMYSRWLEYMYYNASFSMAYNKLSRQQMILRISHFVSNRCIICPWEPDTIQTITQYCLSLRSKCSENADHFKSGQELEFERILIQADPNISAFYNLTETMSVQKISRRPNNPTVSRLPQSYNFVQLENSLRVVFHYMLNKESFYNDRTQVCSIVSLEKDVEKLQKIIGEREMSPQYLLVLHKLLKSQTRRNTVGLCFHTQADRSYVEYVKTYMEHGMNYTSTYRVVPRKVVCAKDPITGVDVYYRDFSYTSNKDLKLLESITQLFFFLKVVNNLSDQIVRETLLSCRYLITGNTVASLLENIKFSLGDQRLGFHKKMLGFFYAYLLNRWAFLEAYIESSSTVLHRYYDPNTDKDLKGTEFKEAVFFHYQDANFLGVSDNTGKYLITEPAGMNKMMSAYWVMMSLFGEITKSKLEKKIMSDFTRNIPNEKKRENLPLECAVVKAGDFYKISDEFEESLPIYIRKRVRYYNNSDKLKIDIGPTISVDSASVFLGRVKLFTLPLWVCSHEFILSVPKVIVGNLDLSKICRGTLLSDYLSGRLNPSEEDIVDLLEGKDTVSSIYSAQLSAKNISDKVVEECLRIDKCKYRNQSKDKPAETDIGRCSEMSFEEMMKAVSVGKVEVLDDELLMGNNPVCAPTRIAQLPKVEMIDQYCNDTDSDLDFFEWDDETVQRPNIEKLHKPYDEKEGNDSLRLDLLGRDFKNLDEIRSLIMPDSSFIELEVNDLVSDDDSSEYSSDSLSDNYDEETRFVEIATHYTLSDKGQSYVMRKVQSLIPIEKFLMKIWCGLDLCTMLRDIEFRANAVKLILAVKAFLKCGAIELTEKQHLAVSHLINEIQELNKDTYMPVSGVVSGHFIEFTQNCEMHVNKSLRFKNEEMYKMCSQSGKVKKVARIGESKYVVFKLSSLETFMREEISIPEVQKSGGAFCEILSDIIELINGNVLMSVLD